MRYAIIGAGRIAPVYLELARMFPAISCVAIADRTIANAQTLGARFGVAATSIEAVLADPEIDCIVNLTPIPAHFALSQAILVAGKHLYSEKPLAEGLGEARVLFDLAAASGVAIAAAPDTFLGAAWQQARRLIDSGIGRPIGADAQFMMDGSRFSAGFLSGAVGPLRELGPYYLTALIALLGPVARLAATTRTHVASRPVGPGGGQMAIETPTAIHGLLDFVSGAVAHLTVSIDGGPNTAAPITIHGTEGSLVLPDPNFFGGDLLLLRRNGKRETIPTSGLPLGAFNWADGSLANYRSVGLADMAAAIASGRPPRASADMALHVTEIIEALFAAGSVDAFIALESTCTRPEPLDADMAAALLSPEGKST